jgi:hypothetical protein
MRSSLIYYNQSIAGFLGVHGEIIHFSLKEGAGVVVKSMVNPPENAVKCLDTRVSLAYLEREAGASEVRPANERSMTLKNGIL